jgi:hypothetical protein
MPTMPTLGRCPRSWRAGKRCACARLEAEVARPAYEAKQAAYDGKKGNRGRAPVPLIRTRQPNGRAT